MNDSVVIIYSGQQVSRQRGSQTSRSRIENGNRRRTNGIIGTIYGVSKAAVSKQLKKLHEQLRGSVK